MSTKIYSGYRIKKELSLKELQTLFSEYRKKAYDVMGNLIIDKYAKISAALFEEILNGRRCFNTAKFLIDFELTNMDKNRKKYILNNNILGFSRELANLGYKESITSMRRIQGFDLNCQIMTFPAKRMTLFYVFSENTKYENEFAKMPGVEYYGYWNNTDPEEGISKKAWDTRERKWEEAIGDDTYIERGLSWSLLSNHATPSFQLSYKTPHLFTGDLYETVAKRINETTFKDMKDYIRQRAANRIIYRKIKQFSKKGI